MKRLLVIDDEPYIVNSIYELFLENNQMELDVYKAYSAMEALELLKKAKIDIVLSDIKMPGMDGLALLKEIHSFWPFCKVIFLSAYDRFDYIHEANKDGITYILKTEGDEAIIEAVAKAAKEIDEQVERNELISSAKRQVELYSPILQKEFMLELIEGKQKSETKQEQLDELKINLLADCKSLLLVGRSDEWFVSMESQEKLKQSAIIQAIIEKYFSTSYRYYFMKLDNEMMVWIIQPKNDDKTSDEVWEKTIVYIKGAIESIQNQYKKNTGSTVSFVIDNCPIDWDEISERFTFINKLMIYKGVNNSEMVLTKADLSCEEDFNSKNMKNVSLWLDKIRSFETFLESGQHKDFYSLLNDLKKELMHVMEDNPIIRIQIYFSLSLLFLKYISRYDSLMDRVNMYPEIIKITNINAEMKCEDTFEAFEKIADLIFVYQKDEKERNQNVMISSLNEYIKNNLNGDLSLVHLAEHVYLNPIYLSRLYKQTTGKNISTYIHDVRLAKAKRLLKESNSKICDISEAVGYGSVAYFIRTFKENTGMTPQDYRES